MAKNLGSSIKTFIKSSASDVWLGGETSSNINLNAEVQEYTDKSSKWAQNMAGKMSGNLEVTVYADNEDAGQKAAITAFLAGTQVDFVQGLHYFYKVLIIVLFYKNVNIIMGS